MKVAAYNLTNLFDNNSNKVLLVFHYIPKNMNTFYPQQKAECKHTCLRSNYFYI